MKQLARHSLILLLSLWLGVYLVGCGQPGEETAVSPTLSPLSAPTWQELTILYTNDEHGWMTGTEPGRGAAELLGLWRDQEGYQPDGNFLILSGGDMWTGPAISTWFDGQSMAEVMHAMGYDAAAVGNHEFDFGPEMFQVRAQQSPFPLLSANMRYRADGRFLHDRGVEPYTILQVNGPTVGPAVGIIGLTTRSTPTTTNPTYVADLEFQEYEATLRQIVPELKAAGAQLILVPAHICQAEMVALAQAIGDLGIHFLGGGHCHEEVAEVVNGIALLQGGSNLRSYGRATFRVNTSQGVVEIVDVATKTNEGGTADPTLAALIQQWQAAADTELDVVIGHTANGISRYSPAMQHLIAESWLWSYPLADVSITNSGGIRADIPPGDITLGDIIGVLPFNNVLVELHLNGQQLVQVLTQADEDAIGGTHAVGFSWVLHRTGAKIQPDGQYTLLVNDFMYAGGDNYGLLAEFDPNGYNTAVDWRQPVIDWIEAQHTSAENPLEPILAELGRP